VWEGDGAQSPSLDPIKNYVALGFSLPGAFSTNC